jgi:hypothetical protein
MVEQYPDSIIITVTTPVQNEETGSFEPGTSVTYTWKCRAEMNGAGRKIAMPDGSLYEYAFSIYLPKKQVIIPFESAYQLTKGGAEFTGKIKGMTNGQFNSIIWA